MAEIRHLENRHDVFFSAEDESKSKPDVEFQYGGRLGEFNGMSSQSHLPHCRVLPPGEFIRHIENRFSTYLFFLVFKTI